jgi:hypothetical protein
MLTLPATRMLCMHQTTVSVLKPDVADISSAYAYEALVV